MKRMADSWPECLTIAGLGFLILIAYVWMAAPSWAAPPRSVPQRLPGQRPLTGYGNVTYEGRTYQVPRFLFQYVGAGNRVNFDQAVADRLEGALIERVAQRAAQLTVQAWFAEAKRQGILPEPEEGETPPGPPMPRAGVLPEDPVVAVFRDNCASCHTGAKAKGALPLFSEQGAFLGARLSQPGRLLIVDRVTHEDPAERMPPKKTLPVESLARIRVWARKGPAAAATPALPPPAVPPVPGAAPGK